MDKERQDDDGGLNDADVTHFEDDISKRFGYSETLSDLGGKVSVGCRASCEFTQPGRRSSTHL